MACLPVYVLVHTCKPGRAATCAVKPRARIGSYGWCRCVALSQSLATDALQAAAECGAQGPDKG